MAHSPPHCDTLVSPYCSPAMPAGLPPALRSNHPLHPGCAEACTHPSPPVTGGCQALGFGECAHLWTSGGQRSEPSTAAAVAAGAADVVGGAAVLDNGGCADAVGCGGGGEGGHAVAVVAAEHRVKHTPGRRGQAAL
eukprot:scaffold68829_cov18-Tisochrysis_lutea.AAC.1